MSDEPIELTKTNELTLEKNLIWVIGMHRSGTTWLGTQLLNINAHVINEWQIGHHFGSTKGGLQSKKFIRNFDYFQKSNNYFFSNKYKPIWIIFLRKLILNRIFAQFKDLSKKIIIKEPSSSIIPDLIVESLPNSKILFLIRDGRDIIDSNVDAFQNGSWRTRNESELADFFQKNRLDYIKRLSMSWKERTKLMIETAKKSNNCLIIKYEELLKDTSNVLEKIYKFVDIKMNSDEILKIIEKFSFQNIPEEQKGKGKFIRSATPGLWKKNFSEKEKNIMNEIMGGYLQSLGYD